VFGVQKNRKKVMNDGLKRMCKEPVLDSLKLTEKRSQKNLYLGLDPNHIPSERKCRKLNLEGRYFIRRTIFVYKPDYTVTCISGARGESQHPCGGGVEYLHRNPTSRRRRRKGKSQM
jgi:hypothetical protein